MIENVPTQLTVFHCFAHCLLPGRAFASLYALLFLEKEAEIGGRGICSVICVYGHLVTSSDERFSKLLNPMEFFKQFDKLGQDAPWYIFRGHTQVIISQKKKIFHFLLRISILSKQTMQTLMKCRNMRHFIWVFTVCQSTLLEVSIRQRVKRVFYRRPALIFK